MAHELEKTGKTEIGENSKRTLNRREYIKSSAVVATIVAGSGIGLTDVTSGDGTGNAFSTGFGEYT
ncbi:hypothetical protein [Halovenus sp. HT40]|uniref:hypothetical protein n=1 Tax=Halovenus sp. HT40 TaxID=3126691 RepID=UPI00300F022D